MPCRWTLAALLAAALATPAAALDTFGPAFGANRYAASIRASDGIPDDDDYVGALLVGEKLSVAVAASRGSALLPALSLPDPDGSETAPPVVEKSGGKSVSLASFAVPKTRRWGVRVAGKSGTEGAYTIAFSVKPAPRLPAVKQHLGGAGSVARHPDRDAARGEPALGSDARPRLEALTRGEPRLQIRRTIPQAY